MDMPFAVRDITRFIFAGEQPPQTPALELDRCAYVCCVVKGRGKIER
jgi:hypothetical protein